MIAYCDPKIKAMEDRGHQIMSMAVNGQHAHDIPPNPENYRVTFST